MTDTAQEHQGYEFDPFDHDGFLVSRKSGLSETKLIAMHPDGEFICSATRPHRTLVRLAYGLCLAAVVLVVLVVLIGVFATVAGRNNTSPLLTIGAPIATAIVLLPVGLYFMQRAPESPTVVRLSFHSSDDPKDFAIRVRRARTRLFGMVMSIEDAHGEEVARFTRHGANDSDYSLWAIGETIATRFVPQRKWDLRTSQFRASLLFGPLGAMLLASKTNGSWDIFRSDSRVRIGALVCEKPSQGLYVLDLTDDRDRQIDRRAITAAVMMVLATQPKS